MGWYPCCCSVTPECDDCLVCSSAEYLRVDVSGTYSFTAYVTRGAGGACSWTGLTNVPTFQSYARGRIAFTAYIDSEEIEGETRCTLGVIAEYEDPCDITAPYTRRAWLFRHALPVGQTYTCTVLDAGVECGYVSGFSWPDVSGVTITVTRVSSAEPFVADPYFTVSLSGMVAGDCPTCANLNREYCYGAHNRIGHSAWQFETHPFTGIDPECSHSYLLFAGFTAACDGDESYVRVRVGIGLIEWVRYFNLWEWNSITTAPVSIPILDQLSSDCTATEPCTLSFPGADCR